MRRHRASASGSCPWRSPMEGPRQLELSGPDLEQDGGPGCWERGGARLLFYLASSWIRVIQTSLPVAPADKLRTFNDGKHRDVTSIAPVALAC